MTDQAARPLQFVALLAKTVGSLPSTGPTLPSRDAATVITGMHGRRSL